MKMSRRFVLSGSLIVLSGALAPAAGAAGTPTFNKDVLPILQQKCQSCHRPGQIAPMSLLTYRDARPWARAIKAAVTSKKMPPWFADVHYGMFRNNAALTPSEIDTIAAWVESGSDEGDPRDAPPRVRWPADGWQVQPDVIVEGVPYTVPAHTKNNVIEWMWVVVPNPFKEDTWVTSIEVRPSEPSVTHHLCIRSRPHTPDVDYGAFVWEQKVRDREGSVLADRAGIGGGGRELTLGTELLGCYVPGRSREDYGAYQAAKLIPAGSDLVFMLHYTPNGHELTDVPRVGFTVAKTTPGRRYITLAPSPRTDAKHFAIPPNDGDWKSPEVKGTFLRDCELVWMSPHMHVRGKDMTYALIYPDGRRDVVLSVPHYDFNWQLGYTTANPIKIPKGTKMVVTAHFDNSSANRANPNPTRSVYYGEMSWEEMMVPFFSVVVDGTERNGIFLTDIVDGE